MIQNLLWRLLGKKYLLGGVVEIYRLLTGYKTQIVSVLLVVVYIAKIFGFITPEMADQLILLLSGAGGVTLAQKFKRWDDDFKLTERMSELKGEAMKQLEADKVVAAAPAAKPDEGVRG